MLIRLVSHFINNPSHIDKLIVIKGIPEDWVFRSGPEGKELVKPWEPDIDANIPLSIRHLCTPTELTFRFAPISKGEPWVSYKRVILGLKLSYMTEPGRELWEKIEEYIDRSLPRDARLPIPVLVAKDQKSPFETYLPKRRVSGGLELEPAEVPIVDLRSKEAIAPLVLVVPDAPIPAAPLETKESEEEAPAPTFACDECDRIFVFQKVLKKHKKKAHKKEKVGV